MASSSWRIESSSERSSTPAVQRGGVAVFFEDVPAAEHEIVEIGERNEVLDPGRAAFGAFAETDRAHLRERTNGL